MTFLFGFVSGIIVTILVEAIIVMGRYKASKLGEDDERSNHKERG